MNKISSISYSDDDYDEQYEEYCRQYEEEKVLYVDGGLSRDEDGDFYGQAYRKEIRIEPSMVKKDLSKMKEACENMPRCYHEYLTLGKKICADICFKEFFFF